MLWSKDLVQIFCKNWFLACKIPFHVINLHLVTFLPRDDNVFWTSDKIPTKNSKDRNVDGCPLTDLICESILLGAISILPLSSNIRLDRDCLPKQFGASWITIHRCDEDIKSNFLKQITRDWLLHVFLLLFYKHELFLLNKASWARHARIKRFRECKFW